MTIPLEREAITDYLDSAIQRAREEFKVAPEMGRKTVFASKIHTLQEVRVALLGERLMPEED